MGVQLKVTSSCWPIPNSRCFYTLLIYDEGLSRPLRVTDLACFVGILMSELYVIDEFSTVARKLNQRSFHSNLESSEHLSVPTLHVLFAKSLSTTVAKGFPRYIYSFQCKAVAGENSSIGSPMKPWKVISSLLSGSS